MVRQENSYHGRYQPILFSLLPKNKIKINSNFQWSRYEIFKIKNYLIHSVSLFDMVIKQIKIQRWLGKHWRSLKWLSLFFMKPYNLVDKFSSIWVFRMVQDHQFLLSFRRGFLQSSYGSLRTLAGCSRRRTVRTRTVGRVYTITIT